MAGGREEDRTSRTSRRRMTCGPLLSSFPPMMTNGPDMVVDKTPLTDGGSEGTGPVSTLSDRWSVCVQDLVREPKEKERGAKHTRSSLFHAYAVYTQASARVM
jgi:hypothetical protein